MKKILSILSTFGIAASTPILSTTVVSCSRNTTSYSGTYADKENLFNSFLNDYADKYGVSVSRVDNTPVDPTAIKSFDTSNGFDSLNKMLNSFNNTEHHPAPEIDNNSKTYKYGVFLYVYSGDEEINRAFSPIAHIEKYVITEKYGTKIGSVKTTTSLKLVVEQV